jgi:hypothetical protein
MMERLLAKLKANQAKTYDALQAMQEKRETIQEVLLAMQ